MVLVFLNIYLTKHLNFSLLQAGKVLSAYGLGSVIGGYLGGHFCDRFGVRNVQLGSLLRKNRGRRPLAACRRLAYRGFLILTVTI